MRKHGLENIKNVFNPVQDKLPQIIEYFVDFYGERYRKQIEERINNTTFIFYERGDFMLLEKYFQSLKDTFAGEFYDEYTNSVKGDYLFEDFSFESLSFYLKQVKRWQKEIKNSDLKEIYEFLKTFKLTKLLPENNGGLKESISSSEYIVKLKGKFKEFENLYNYCYKDDFDYLNHELERMNQVLPNDKIELVEREFDISVKDIVGVGFLKYLMLEINYENVEYLDNIAPFLMNYFLTKKELVSQKDKLKFFEIKEKLYNLSSLNKKGLEGLSEKEKNIIIDEIVGHPLELIKDRLLDLYHDKQVKISNIKANFDDVYNLISEKVTGKNAFLSIVNSFKYNMLSEEAYNLLCPGLPNSNQTYNIVFYSSVIRMLDSVLIHEINHSVSSSARVEKSQSYPDSNYLEVLCKYGFLSRKYLEDGKGNLMQYFDAGPDYTPLNEAINEYISQKICGKILEDGFQIGRFNASEGVSIYTSYFPLLKYFFKNNMNEIISCNMSEDENLIYSTFGRENIDQIAQAVYNYSVLKKFNNTEFSDFIKEKKLKLGKADVFSSLNDSSIKWSENAGKFIRCYQMIDEAVENIELYKKEKQIQDNSQKGI